MRIIATKRRDDVYACIEGKPEIWGTGKNVFEVVRDLKKEHSEYFEGEQTEITWNLDDVWTRRYVNGDPFANR